MEQSLVLHSCT